MPVYGSLRLSARAEDERSFEAMFRRHHAPLLSYCRHMLGDRDEAEDALQQAFIRAHRAMLGGTKPREARPWLYAIARNCCLSAIAARKPTAPLQDHTPMLAGLSEQVRRREDLRELVAGIARLPEDQRSALLLAELEDLDHREIAEIVGCPVNKVKALIYQARSTLIADRDALDTPCRDIREQLAVARGGELRRGRLRRHLNLCAGCRDFQLAVGAQRQSLATVLPVLPTVGLATAILGHAAAHTAGTAAGGAGLSASGATATSTAVGAGASAGGGSGIGTLLGGGLATKLAFGGTVAVLATAGAVAIRHPAHADQRSMQSGSRQGALRRDGPSTSPHIGVAMLNTAFVQAGEGAPQPGASGSGASGSRASASAFGEAGGSAVAALSPDIAGAVTTPLAETAPASPAPAAPSGSAAGASGKRSQSHIDRQRPISKGRERRAAQRKLRRQRRRARRRLLKQRRVLERRQMLKRRRQLKRRQIAERRSRRVAASPHPPAASPLPPPTPARPPHRHRPSTTTTSTLATSPASSSPSAATTEAPTPKTSGRRRTQTTGGPSTGEAAAGTSGTPATTSGSASSKHAGDGKPSGASDPGTGAQACDPEATSRANATVQPRRDTTGHTRTCPAARQEEA